MVGSCVVESGLANKFPEHLNAEIILGTICSVGAAAAWVRSTYLYMRMRRNPGHYGLPEHIETEELDTRILEMCGAALETMAGVGLVLRRGEGVGGTGLGRLMSRHYLAYSTMELLTSDMEAATISQLLEIICRSREMSDTFLRTNEKTTLNNLNRNRDRRTVKFQFPGKIKNAEMKVNILVQASLGCMTVSDAGLSLETPRVMRLAARILTCLVEVVLNDPNKSQDFILVRNVLYLSQSLTSGIWGDSVYVSKQMNKIGVVVSRSIAEGGFTTMRSMAEANPRILELAAKKSPPFGNSLSSWASRMPDYSLTARLTSVSTTSVTAEILLSLNNRDLVEIGHKWVLVAGKGSSVLALIRGHDNLLIHEPLRRTVSITRQSTEDTLEVSVISISIAGVDRSVQLHLERSGEQSSSLRPGGHNSSPRPGGQSSSRMPGGHSSSQRPGGHSSSRMPGGHSFSQKTGEHSSSQRTGAQGDISSVPGLLSQFRRECRHSCADKTLCGHECCKTGVRAEAAPRSNNAMESIRQMKFTFKSKPTKQTTIPDFIDGGI